MLPALLLVAFIVVPIVEIYVIIQVGQAIGGWETVALLLAESALGAWLVRREGRRTWAALRNTLSGGGLPSRELADAALFLAGGVLLLTPGFVTDALGFLLILPPTRAVARRLLLAWVARRAQAAAAGWAGGVLPPWGMPGMRRAPRPPGSPSRPHGSVIPGEVVEPGGPPLRTEHPPDDSQR